MGVVQSKTVVSADEAIMSKAGRWYARLIQRSERIGERDCIIAATAMVLEEPVVTANAEHFDRIDDLEVWSY